jgi:hypothetical protein
LYSPSRYNQLVEPRSPRGEKKEEKTAAGQEIKGKGNEYSCNVQSLGSRFGMKTISGTTAKVGMHKRE